MNFDQINKIKKLLNKKEKILICFLFIMMIINSFLEILSIGALIPLIALFFEGNNSSIFSNIPVLQNIFSNLTFFLDIKSILIIIFLIFFVKNFFIIFYHFVLEKL